MSCNGRGLYRILSTWMVFGDTCEEDEDFGKSAPFLFLSNHEKSLLLIVLWYSIDIPRVTNTVNKYCYWSIIETSIASPNNMGNKTKKHKI